MARKTKSRHSNNCADVAWCIKNTIRSCVIWLFSTSHENNTHSRSLFKNAAHCSSSIASCLPAFAMQQPCLCGWKLINHATIWLVTIVYVVVTCVVVGSIFSRTGWRATDVWQGTLIIVCYLCQKCKHRSEWWLNNNSSDNNIQ